VGERRHADRAILLRRTQAFRETDERPGQAARDVVHTEAFDAVREIDGPLHQDCSSATARRGRLVTMSRFRRWSRPSTGCFPKPWPARSDEADSARPTRQKTRRAGNVDHHLMAVVGQAGNFDLAFDDQEDVGGRLVLVVDHLAFLVLHNAGAGQMREGIFECFPGCKYRGVVAILSPPTTSTSISCPAAGLARRFR